MADVVPNPSRLKNQVQPPELPGLQALTTLAVGVVVVAALYLAREVLVPITLAILLSFVLAPLVALLRRIGLMRVPAVVVAVLLAFGVLLLLGGVIGSQLAGLASDAPRYAATVERKVETVRSYTIGRLTAMTGKLGRQLDDVQPPVPNAKPAPNNPPSDTPKPVPVEVHQPDPTPVEIATRVLSPILSPLATMALVLLVSVFILMQREDLRDRMIRLFGSRDLHRTTGAMDEAAARLSKYFLTQLALNAAFGAVIGLGLLIIGVPNPVLWGIIAALMRFVPYIGAIGSAILPITMAAAVDPGWTMALSTAALFLVVEPLTGQVVEPLVYGHSTGLSPVSVVIAAIFWAWLWGPVGLILSMPLTLCLVVLGRHIDRLQFIDVLLGDQPALTPAESFYQRILAGDSDEALDQAEVLLRDRALSSYYDEVALKGLQLAANDSLRGVLTDDQLRNIQDAIDGVVVDLADHDDVDPSPSKADRGNTPVSPTVAAPPIQPAPTGDAGNLAAEWAGPAPILCVAGRGPLDEAACTMLAQLLGKHGLRARVISQDAASRAHIMSLDVEGVAMVCVSYLEASGSPSPLRYLMRRLRQRLPGAPILVGLWQADAAVLADERLRAAVGADHYVTTLRDTVNACLAAVQAASEAAHVTAGGPARALSEVER
jgi:predicted PurR-regulated permease PerM